MALGMPLALARGLARRADDPMHDPASRDAGGWRMTPPPAAGGAITLPSGLLSVEHAQLAVDADQCPTPRLRMRAASRPVRFDLSWRRQDDPTTYATQGRPVVIADGDGIEVTVGDLALHRAWTGRIVALRWQLQFEAHRGETPTVISVGVPRASAGELADALWRQWWSTEPLGSATVNSIRPPHVLGRSPTVWLGLAAVSVVGVYVLQAGLRRRCLRKGPIAAATIAAWVAFDARWLAGTFERDLARLAPAATMPAELPPLACPPVVIDAAELARRTLPPGAIYAVAGGNLPTTAGDSRLRYLLSPRWIQVNSDPLQPPVAPERAQFIIVLDEHAISLNPATSELRAAGLPVMVVAPWSGTQQRPFILQRVDQ